MKRLRVYGGWTSTAHKPSLNGGRQARTIVAAPNKRRAVEILARHPLTRVSRYEFNGYWCETGNANELATATREGIWVNQGDWNNPKWEELPVGEGGEE